MFKQIKPKMWKAFLATVVVILACWGLVRKSDYSDSPEEIRKVAKATARLDPVVIQNPDEETRTKILAIEDIFRRKKNAGFNGNVLVVQKGKILFQNSYGYAHLKEKDSLTSDSKFQLASLSKPVTAIAVLKLVQDKKISLQDTIQKFFPEFPYPGVDIGMLLSHRSGLPNYIYSFPDSVRQNRNYPSNMDVMNWFAKVENKPQPYSKPNRSFVYCNTNYLVLAAIVEKVSGNSFGNYLRKQIFLPLGMANSYLITDTSAIAMEHRTAGYERGRKIAKDFYDDVVGDKGLYSTVGDMYRFYSGVSSGMIIDKKLLSEALMPRSFERKGIRNYGYGFRMHIKEDHSVRFVYHGGWWKGYNTMMWVSPEDEAVIIVLGNTYNRNTYDVKELMEVLHGKDNVGDIDKDI
jgi:CubicO group peptidase (beta-lactamase class C family)